MPVSSVFFILPLRRDVSYLFQRRAYFENQYSVEFNPIPLFEKEGLGEIYQSVIMKLRLTDQHYSDQEGLIYFTSSNSISKMSVLFGPITSPEPTSPYARFAGIKKRLLPPTFMV